MLLLDCSTDMRMMEGIVLNNDMLFVFDVDLWSLVCHIIFTWKIFQQFAWKFCKSFVIFLRGLRKIWHEKTYNEEESSLF